MSLYPASATTHISRRMNGNKRHRTEQWVSIGERATLGN